MYMHSNHPLQIPDGAIRGDVSKQVFCPLCHDPKYFYADETRHCVQCQRSFTFSAREQKFWYESLKFNFLSTAVRCAECRRKRRNERSLHAALGIAVAQAEKTPDDPLAQVELACATVALRERYGQGNLNRAIAAARKAARLSPNLPEALYWEARCQGLAGRGDKARDLLVAFLERAKGLKRLRKLKSRATELLAD